MSLRRKIYYIFTLAVVTVMLVLPSTGWLVQMQLMPFKSASINRIVASELSSDSTKKQPDLSYITQSVGEKSQDISLRYAAALNSDRKVLMRNLTKLNEQEPNNPMILAARLRYLTCEEVIITRAKEEVLIFPPAKDSVSGLTERSPGDPAILAKFLALAAQGEQAEPQNSYFPTMAAVGYFAGHEDNKAMAAWKRASEKPLWNDYTTDEVMAKWKLLQTVNKGAEIGALARIGSTGVVIHYGSILSAARLAIVKAMQAEIAGDKEAGFVLRQETRQLGQKIQTQGKRDILNMVGGSIIDISDSRPGGREIDRNRPYDDYTEWDGKWMIEKQNQYVAYLRQVGRPEEATAFQQAIAQKKTIGEIMNDSDALTYSGTGSKIFELFGAWVGNTLLLSSVLFSLTFAGIFKLIYRFSPQIQRGEPLPIATLWGIVSGLSLPGIVAFLICLTDELYMDSWLAGIVIGGLLLITAPIFLRFSRKQVGQGIIVLLTTIATLTLVVGVGALCWTLFQKSVAYLYLDCLTSVIGYHSEVYKDFNTIKQWLVCGLVSSIPLALFLLFGTFSRILKVPLAAGVTRGMRSMGVPLACFLLLVWSGSLLYTVKQENAAITQMKQFMENGQSQTMARMLGRSFPH